MIMRYCDRCSASLKDHFTIELSLVHVQVDPIDISNVKAQSKIETDAIYVELCEKCKDAVFDIYKNYLSSFA